MRKENHQGNKIRNRSTHKPVSSANINLSYLKEMADGDQHFIIEVIEMFLDDAPDVLQQAVVYHKSDNFPLLKISVHKLKSSIKMMGDDALATLAQDIENLALSATPHEVLTHELHKFSKGVHKLLEGLQVELKRLKKLNEAA